MNYVKGLDVSKWQRDRTTPSYPNFEKAKVNGAEFVFIKATESDNYVDPEFKHNWKAAKDAGLLRGAYHFLDYRIHAQPQIAHFAALLEDDPGELPPVLDLERNPKWYDLPWHRSLVSWLKECFDSFHGHDPILYTNTSTIKYNLSPVPDWLQDVGLWVAYYPNPWARLRKRQPKVTPWKRWDFWQHTDRADGKAYGMESKQVDENYFNGTLEELYTYAAEPAPPKLYTNEEKLERLWGAHHRLW